MYIFFLYIYQSKGGKPMSFSSIMFHQVDKLYLCLVFFLHIFRPLSWPIPNLNTQHTYFLFCTSLIYLNGYLLKLTSFVFFFDALSFVARWKSSICCLDNFLYMGQVTLWWVFLWLKSEVLWVNAFWCWLHPYIWTNQVIFYNYTWTSIYLR